MEIAEKVVDMAKRDGRYSHEAFLFVFRALNFTANRTVERTPAGHVTGRELLEGIRHTGLDEFGYLARTVFNSWGLKATRDFGEIVFLLVDDGLMGKNDEDAIEDFDDVYDFEEAFEKAYTVDWDKLG
jgi:uncharacterized repeat protein (TIGR04138 family)